MNTELISRNIRYAYIRNHPVFTHINEKHFNEICSFVRLRRMKRRRFFLLTEDHLNKIYFINNGTVKLTGLSETDTSFVKDILVDGDVFGDLLLNGKTIEGQVISLRSNTNLFYFNVTDFKMLLEQFPVLAINYSVILANKLRLLEARHTVWTNGDARQRLLYFFRGWTACAGTKTDSGIVLENYFSLRDIGDFIGVSRQSIHIILKDLKKKNLVYYTRNTIFVSFNFLEQN